MTTTHGPAEDAGSAQGIPTRLVVEALVRADGTVDAAELYTVAGLLGMTDQQVRLCVRRLVAEGRFTQEGRGRKAVLRASADPATGSLAPDADHVRYAYLQDAGLAAWDGTWHLFAFAIPETRRGARDALRDTLIHLGAAPVHGGLYVAANPVAGLVEAHARELGLLDALTTLTSTDLRVGGTAEPRALARALWRLDEIAGRYDRLDERARTHLARLGSGRAPSGAERLTMAVELAAAFTEAMTPDPLLPPELLPQPWPGTVARRVAADCWSALEADGSTGGVAGVRLFALYADVPA